MVKDEEAWRDSHQEIASFCVGFPIIYDWKLSTSVVNMG